MTSVLPARMKSAMAINNGAASSSLRYQRLQQVLEKALSESRKAFDTNEAVKQCYGDDASIFGNPEMLVSVMDGMVDKVSHKVQEEMLQYFKDQDVEAKLQTVEEIITALQRSEQENNDIEKKDRQSAQEALQKAKLPEGMTPQDVVAHRAYIIMKQERDALKEELDKVEAETAKLEEQLREAEDAVQKNLESVEHTGKELERTADLCSIMS